MWAILKPLNLYHTFLYLERVMGIEPTSSAWKAEVLPLNYTRNPLLLILNCQILCGTPEKMRKN